MRALVTGSAGFAGTHLLDLLREERILSAGFDLVHGDDVRDYEQVRTAVQQYEPDLVFHLAAISWPRESLADPRRTLDINITGALNVLEAVLNTGSHARVLLAGTSEEYGYEGRDGEVLTESAACRPANAYGISKLAATGLGMAYAKRYSLPVVVTRAFNHTGPGRQAVNAESSFARRIAAVERGDADSAEHGDLSAVRNLSDVRDVVRAYRAVIMLESGIYNVCADRNVTMGEVMSMLTSLASVPVTLKQNPRLGSAPEAGFPLPSHQKLTRACGWQPVIPLETTMGDLLEYWRSR